MGRKRGSKRSKKSKIQSPASEPSSASVVATETPLQVDPPVLGSTSNANLSASRFPPEQSSALNNSNLPPSSAFDETVVASSEQSSSQEDKYAIILAKCDAAVTEYQRGNVTEAYNLIKAALAKHYLSGLLHSLRAWMCKDICSKSNDVLVHARYLEDFLESAGITLICYPNAIGCAEFVSMIHFNEGESYEDYRRVYRVCKDALMAENPTDILPECLMVRYSFLTVHDRISKLRQQLLFVMGEARVEMRKKLEAIVAAVREEKRKQDAQQNDTPDPEDSKEIVTNKEVSGSAQDGQSEDVEVNVAAARHTEQKQDDQQLPKNGSPEDSKEIVTNEEVSGSAQDGQSEDVEVNVAAARHTEQNQDAQQLSKNGSPEDSKEIVTNEEVSGSAQDGQSEDVEMNVAAARHKEKKHDAQQLPKNDTPEDSREIVTNAAEPAGQNDIDKIAANVEAEPAGKNEIVVNAGIPIDWVPEDFGIECGLSGSREEIARIIRDRQYPPERRGRRLALFRSFVLEEDL